MSQTRIHFVSLLFFGVLLLATQTHATADESFNSNGVKINYATKGQGEPVILIHGWLSSGWINWELTGIYGELAKEYQVIRIDMPGHGSSEQTTKENAYGAELGEHVIRLMNHLKIKQAHIVGYSMGGIITAHLAVKHADRMLSATLGGMGWLREESLEQKFFAGGGKDGKPVGLCFQSLAKLALSETEIKAIKTPTLILFGEKDFLKIGYTLPLKKVRPDWKIIEISGGDHISTLLKPQFKTEILIWLKSQKQKP
jgi:pimeloyl-ACP methyl ester carboxylesterase